MKETNSTEELYDDEFDFNTFFAILWQRKKLIIFGTLLATLLSIGISLLIPRVYRSEGFFQLGNPAKKISENEKRHQKRLHPLVFRCLFIRTALRSFLIPTVLNNSPVSINLLRKKI